MAKRFIFRQANVNLGDGKGAALAVGNEARKFAEPTQEQIAKAKDTWKRLAPTSAKNQIR